MPLNVLLFHHDPKVQPVREFATKPFVAIGCGTKPVIEVRETSEREFSFFSEITQQEQQCDRIGSARNGDEHTTAGRA